MVKTVNDSLTGKKIFVGLSGGVDSAVTAALLQEQGADVTGVFIKGWYPPGMPCTWSEDRRDAMRVAAHLRIPFLTLDASEEYKKSVIDYLLSEYRAGRTPNPDIMCNRDVKFGAFYHYAMEQGADYIATGHYARTKEGKLLRGIDSSKDQSYFLWAVPKETLSNVLFPLGDLQKSHVRELAKKFKLPNAVKKDSQGICFLGNISIEDFLRQEFGSEDGQAYDEQGALIGRHNGALLHTIGERVSLADAPQGPWYVVSKNMDGNALIVSKERSQSRGTESPRHLTSCNFIAPNLLSAPLLTAQYRYHGPIQQGIFSEDTCTWVPNETSGELPASGQSLVIYLDDECLGGGIIT